LLTILSIVSTIRPKLTAIGVDIRASIRDSGAKLD
jgi:hypothetical protein